MSIGVVISRKPCSGHRLTQSRDDVAAENDVLLDSGVSEVEIAVLEALGLISLAAAVYFKGQLVIAALPRTSIFSGTTSISPVGSLGFLLARSRTVPSTEMVDSPY